jgi:hypothetical protein
MPRWQRYGLGGLTLLAWVALIGVSIAANIKFAWGLGEGPFEQFVLSFGSVASDVFKAACPVALIYYWARRHWSRTAATAALGMVALTFSVVAAFGFMSGERYRAYHDAQKQYVATKAMQKDVERATAARDWSPVTKPLRVLEAEKRAAEFDLRYRTTKNCTTASGPLEQWCREYRALDVAIENAKSATEAEGVVAEKRQTLATKGRTYGDAQIEQLSAMTGMSGETVLKGMVILAVLLIELGSAFGLTVALGLLVPEVMDKIKLTVTPKVPLADKQEATVQIVKAPAGLSPVRRAASFNEPAAARPESGGFRSKMRPFQFPRIKLVA